MNIVEVFPWNENFETGILQIDDQHKRLVNLLNILASHLAYKADKGMLDTILNELTDYTLYHFSEEEALWQQFLGDDEWKVEHKKEHLAFIDEISKLKTEHTQTKTLNKIAEDILSFLTHWLAFHILDCDRRMAKLVLAMMHSDLSLEAVKQQVDLQMSGGTRLLIETILSMYDSLSARTLQLIQEITERQKVEEKLRLAANVFDNTLDAICITDTSFMVIDANPSFYKITELSEQQVLHQNLCLLKTGLLTEKQVNNFLDTFNETGHWSGLIQSRKKNGEIVAEWLTLSIVKSVENEVSHYVAIFSNISHLIRHQQTLEKIAHHDVLTGLPNRLLLQDRLKLAIAHAKRTHTLLAVCYIDLDGFKPINDRLGHIVGDYLLQEIAKRFLKTIRATDTIARLGGDEFVMLLSNLKNETDYTVMLDRILLELSQLVQVQDENIKVSASIGVTLFPKDNSNAELLLHHADLAMYRAKHNGKSKYCLYQP